MTIAVGVSKQLRYKKQSALGTAASGASAQLLRRVTSDIDLSKDTYQSNEIRPDMQIADYRHGMWKVGGGVNGELSPGTYKDLIQSGLRRDFTTVTAIASLSITIAGSGPTYTVTRSAGSWLTDGIKAGFVVRLTAGAFNAANSNKNLFVLAVTSATVLTVMPMNGVAMVAEGPIATSTLTTPGKVTYTPTTAQTADYYTFEHWFPDIVQSEVFVDSKIGSLEFGLPATGMATFAAQVMGLKMTRGTSQNFTSPTAATTTGVLAAVNGVLMSGGSAIAVVTGLNVKVDGGMSTGAVVGSNFSPDVFAGRVNVTGQLTAYFDGVTFRDAFVDETALSLAVAMATGTGATADFISLIMPNVKLGGATKSDGEQGLIITAPFQALYNGSGGAGVASEQTTLEIQDSQA
jgi:hypothetical protein